MKTFSEFSNMNSAPKVLNESVTETLMESEKTAELLSEEFFGTLSVAEDLTESHGELGDTIRLEGVFLQAEKLNKNKRVYPKAVLEEAVRQYEREHKNKVMLGELGHPNRAHLEISKSCIMFEDFWWKGNDLWARAQVLNTKDGKKLQKMIRGGMIPGVSSRGLGSLTDVGTHKVVDKNYRITVLADVVLNPSAPDAVVKAY